MRLDLLYAHCADVGLDVLWKDLGEYRFGEYHEDEQLIYLNVRLTTAEATATLAHEFGHYLFGDRCSTPPVERRAWERGAGTIITPPEYEAAERIVGHHPNALAAELGVTADLIHAWRRWYWKRGHLWTDSESLATAVAVKQHDSRSEPAD